jgi:hypothetical protein
MPYLNWATEAERQKLNRIIAIVTKDKSSPTPLDEKAILAKIDRYEKLLWTYLYDRHPLHVRRTLDQFYYSSLDSTEARDNDQIPHKYFKNRLPESRQCPESGQCPENCMHPVLMVDQLWLWVIDEGSRSLFEATHKFVLNLIQGTVITSFPQRWTERRKDELDPGNTTDVIENIIRHLDGYAAEIGSAWDLAALISTQCSQLCFNATISQNGRLAFPECYEIEIGHAVSYVSLP